MDKEGPVFLLFCDSANCKSREVTWGWAMWEKQCYVPQYLEPSHVAPPTAKQAGKWGLCVSRKKQKWIWCLPGL